MSLTGGREVLRMLSERVHLCSVGNLNVAYHSLGRLQTSTIQNFLTLNNIGIPTKIACISVLNNNAVYQNTRILYSKKC